MTTAKYRDPGTGQFVPMPVPVHTHPESGRLVGEITIYAGATAPAGWLVCDGSTVSQTEHPELFAVLGSTYGAPGRLPNMRGRSPLGAGGNIYPDRGTQGGAATHGHVGNPMPSHDHTAVASASNSAHSHNVDIPSVSTSSAGSHTHTTGLPQGGASDHSDGIEPSASSSHTHTTNAGGTHSHTVNPPVTATTSDTHTHNITVNPDPTSAGTPSVQSGDSYHPVLSVLFIIYTGA